MEIESAEKAATCPICCEEIVEATASSDGQEAIQCEGKCDKWYHRWCAGVRKDVYAALAESSTPFFCPSCQLQEHQQLILSLVASVDVLKEEVRLLKLSQEIAKVTTSMPLRVGDAAQETSVPQVSQPSKPPRSSNSGWAKVNSRKSQKSRRPVATVEQTAANPQATDNPNNSPPLSRKKLLPLSGARKIWGTMRSTTTLAVANALKQLAGIDTSKLKINLRPLTLNPVA